MSEQASKKLKTSTPDADERHIRRMMDSGSKPSSSSLSSSSSALEQKISLLEQHIHELQSIHFHNLCETDYGNYPRPATVYADPLINYQFAVIRYKEQQLLKTVLELQDKVGAMNMTKDITQIIALKEENKELKRQLRANNDSIMSMKLTEKDKIIEGLSTKLQSMSAAMDSMHHDSDQLQQQVFLMSQAYALHGQQMISSPQEPLTSYDDHNVDDHVEYKDNDDVGYDRYDNDSPVLEVEAI